MATAATGTAAGAAGAATAATATAAGAAGAATATAGVAKGQTPLVDAIQQQTAQIQHVLHRYIVTEQNLLFEQRCADWMIIQLVRALDRFVATFNTHAFLRRVPLLCRLAEQCGPPVETGMQQKTEKQRAF
jgi:hypothetical protein